MASKRKIKHADITQRVLKELFRYDADTGNLVWIVDRGQAKAGQIAGYVKVSLVEGKYEQKYRYIRIGSVDWAAHRLVWLYHNGEWPKNVIDHVNRDSSDNRIENLRDVTQQVNMGNQSFSKANTTGHRGVYLSNGKYHAKVAFEGRLYSVGKYEEPDVAALAYRAGRELFGLPPAPEHAHLGSPWSLEGRS